VTIPCQKYNARRVASTALKRWITKKITQRARAARSTPGGANQCLPTKGLSGAPDPHRDSALSEEVEVVDVEHPLFGRRFNLISVQTVTCGESLVRVNYRFGLTLLLPIGVTDLEPAVASRALRAKLSVEAVKDLIAVAEGSEGACLSSLKRSGKAYRRPSVGRSPTTSPRSCGS
jgi:hypothetical protein